jgi:hypothetical protein
MAFAPEEEFTPPTARGEISPGFMLAVMVCGDIRKVIDSFQKSLTLDPSQDETWVWRANYQEQGDKPKARKARPATSRSSILTNVIKLGRILSRSISVLPRKVLSI